VTPVAFESSVEDPGAGQRWVFHPRAGDALEADLFVSPGGFVREHAHPTQSEIFECVSGTFVLEVDGMERTLGPGASIVIPPRTRHGFRDAPEAAHLRVTIRPALELEAYFRVFLGLSRDGRIRMPVKGLPSPLLQIAIVMDRFGDEIAAPRIPPRLQRWAWRGLSRIARLRGRRASFPEYGVP
jgi:quercetin dioxygenase-like cupin family protein